MGQNSCYVAFTRNFGPRHMHTHIFYIAEACTGSAYKINSRVNISRHKLPRIVRYSSHWVSLESELCNLNTPCSSIAFELTYIRLPQKFVYLA